MRTHLKRKEVDDVLGGKEAWKNVDKTKGPSSSWPSIDSLSLHYRDIATNSHCSYPSDLSQMRRERGVLYAAPDPIGR
jgi:hypothetical protein